MKKVYTLIVICILIPIIALAAGFTFRDEYSTDRAAGKVDDTAAEPGPGTRDVATDTNSKLTIASGVLTFATGGSAVGDPGLWYAVKTRTVGLGIIGEVTNPDTNASLAIGWDTNQTGAIADYFSFAASGVLNVGVNAGTAIPVGTYTAASNKVGVFQRGTGAFYLANLAGGKWELYWIGAAGVSNNYPASIALGITSVATSSYLRIPTTLWLPTPIAYDTFTRGNGAIGVSETTGPDTGFAPTAKTWASGSTTWTISTNQAINTPTLAGNLTTDGGFETWASSTDLTNWTETIAGTSTLNQDTDAGDLHGGSSAVRCDLDATPSLCSFYQTLTVASTTWLYHSVWAKSSINGGSFRFTNSAGDSLGNAKALTNSYANYFITERLTAANPSRGIKRDTAAGSISEFFDDYTVYPLTLSELFATVPTSTADVIATVTPSTNPAGTQAGLVVNLDSTSNPQSLIIAYHDGVNCKVEELVAGTWNATPKISTSTGCTYNAAYELRVIRDGTELRLYYNNALIGTAQTMTANTNTNHGMFSTYSGNTLNDFSLYARGTGGEYNILNTLNSAGGGGSLMLLGVGK